MGLNKLKGAGKEVEAAFFLFKAASLEKSFHRLCWSWCWNRLRQPLGLVLKKRPQPNSWCYSDLHIYSSIPGGPTCLIFRHDGKLGGSKTSPHSFCFIRVLCLNKRPGTREWWVCLLLCLWCLWLGWELDGMLSFRRSVKGRLWFEVWEGGCGICTWEAAWLWRLGTSANPELLCVPW